MAQHDEVRQAKNLSQALILSKPNVVGVGIGYKNLNGRSTGELSVIVMVTQKIPKAGLSREALVPKEVNGVPTDILPVGHLRALVDHTARYRPSPAGVSIGHYQITAGTFGCVVRDRATGRRMILSNNHVLANSNNASPGDTILQPGPTDGGVKDHDTLAHLERFYPLQFNEEPGTCGIAEAAASVGNAIARLLGSSHRLQVRQVHNQATNQVDAAIARPVDEGEILDEILEIGNITGKLPAALGMSVRKSGRTSGLTEGQVTVLDATVTVSYGFGISATFENQIVTSAMSQGGDSGSLLVAGDPPLAVGLLFAGSDQATIFNPIQLVLDLLEVDLLSQPESLAASTQATIERAEAIRQAHQHRLLAKPNVVGVGVGLRQRNGVRTETVALVVMVRKKLPKSQLAPEDMLPSEIEGIPVDVQEVGEFRAQAIGK